MLRVRRTQQELRVEITPMIDVIFLLLTFFIYSMVLMVRVDLLPIELRQFVSGRPATPAPATTITLDLEGSLYLDREKTTIDLAIPAIAKSREIDPATVVYLAIADGQGTVDRAPILQELWDRLRLAGIPINLVGKPADRSIAPAPPVPATPSGP
ncbi:MAG: ExbD/TolR family protein [Phycisphaerales bacterium]|jgi:biopolymer transport protein ExbD